MFIQKEQEFMLIVFADGLGDNGGESRHFLP